MRSFWRSLIRPSPIEIPTLKRCALTLRGPDAPPNMPLEDFWLTQNEGDKNTNNYLVWEYKAAAAEYGLSCRAAACHGTA